MKGDFSKWYFGHKNSFTGVLHQQGRVLLDSDWNDQTRINIEWQDQAGQDIIGSGVAAVPVSEKDSFKVIEASIAKNIMKHKVNPGRLASNEVHLKIIPGRVWVNGFLVTLPGKENVERIATYLEPPVQKPPAGNTRDLVVLEVWRDSINGFQLPNLLIESALGGPDTTERIHTEMALRLLRLENGDTCYNVADKLKDDFEKKGKLTVSLKTPTPTSGDCPLTDGGGYTGLEHDLYRIEIADINDTSRPMFKWSQFNGGLVGTGTLKVDPESNNKSIEIKDNLQAIISSELNNSYLEIVRYDNRLGHWKVAYGARASLQDNIISLEKPLFSERIPNADEKVFFRLWNGIEYVDPFSKDQAKEPKELKDGIQLEFDSPTTTNYSPGNFWTFSVRAGGKNNDTLIKEKPPEGIHYYRVPLAILKWNNNSNIYFDKEEISDCRKIFNPLVNQNICCSFTVGDGKSSHGDYDSINEALAHLPGSGGEICLLPGLHEASIIIENKSNIKIKGCNEKTKVYSDKDPIFTIVDSGGIIIEHLYIRSYNGPAIVLKSTEEKRVESPILNAGEILRQFPDKFEPLNDEISLNLSTSQLDTESDKISITTKPKEDTKGKVAAAEGLTSNSIGIRKKILHEIKITNNTILAETFAIYSSKGMKINIHNNVIGAIESAIYIEDSDDIEIENNIVTASKNAVHASGAGINIHHNKILMADIEDAKAAIYLTAEGSLIERNEIVVQNTVAKINEVRTFKAPGGIQIAGGSERIKILENLINGGSGNGITLGSTIDLEKVDGLIDDSDEEKHKISLSKEHLEGIVITKTEGPLNRITLSFVPISGSGNILSVTTDENGKFSETAGESAYYVSVSTPGYKIETIEMTKPPKNQASIYVITLIKAKLSPDLEDVLSPIYEVQIERNEISNMGLSGIGNPMITDSKFFSKSKKSFASVDLNENLPNLLTTILLFGNPIINLTIDQNLIFNCVQRDFDENMKYLTKKRGVGGISLGICEDIIIQDNRIYSNGKSHIDPICGIYLAAGKNVEVNSNHITDNGPIDEKNNSNLNSGFRGGLVLKQSSTLADILAQPVFSRVRSKSSYDKTKSLLGTSNLKNYEDYSNIESMIKIHDNIVAQPMGKALFFDVFSPVTIHNNFFNGEILIRNTNSNDEENLLVVKIANNTIFSSDSKSFTIKIIGGHTIELLDNAINSSGLGGINIMSAWWVRVDSNCLNSTSNNPDSYTIQVDGVDKIELLNNKINSSGLGGINMSAYAVRVIANRLEALSSNLKIYTIQVVGDYIELLNNTINSSGLGGININSRSEVEDKARIEIHANSFELRSRPMFMEINSKGKVIFSNNSCDTHIYMGNLGKKELSKMVFLINALNITSRDIIFCNNQCSLYSPTELKSLASVIDAHVSLNSTTANVVGNRCQEGKIEPNINSIQTCENSVILGNITTNKIAPSPNNNLNLEGML